MYHCLKVKKKNNNNSKSVNSYIVIKYVKCYIPKFSLPWVINKKNHTAGKYNNKIEIT